MKNILATYFFLVLSVGAIATPEEIKVVPPLMSDSSRYPFDTRVSGFGSWSLIDRWYVSGDYTCQHDKSSFLGWPAEAVCKSKLSLILDTYIQNPDGTFSLDLYFQNKYGQIKYPKMSVGGENNSEKFVEMLLQHNDPIISMEGVQYKLEDFNPRANASYAKKLAAENTQISTEKNAILMNVSKQIVFLAALVPDVSMTVGCFGIGRTPIEAEKAFDYWQGEIVRFPTFIELRN